MTLWRILMLAGLLVLPACGGGKGKGRRGKRGKRGARVFTVHVKPVAERVLPNDIVALGTTRPLRETKLATQVGGTITELHVKLGQQVKKGALLAKVATVGLYGEAKQVYAELRRLKTELEQANRDLTDSKKLYEQKVASRKEYTDANFKVRRLRAQRAQAKARLTGVGERYRGGRVYAPFAGVISAQTCELGDYVSPGKVVGQLVDLSSVTVTVSLAEVDMVRVHKKMPVVVVFPSLGPKPWPAHIIALSPTADPRTGAFPVELAVANSDGRLKGGMATRVLFKGPGVRGLFVPVEAVVKRGGEPVAFVVPPGPDADSVTQRSCKLGLARDGLVQVLSGLAPGDRLVVAGNTRLRAGSKIRLAGSIGPRPRPTR